MQPGQNLWTFFIRNNSRLGTTIIQNRYWYTNEQELSRLCVLLILIRRSWCPAWHGACEESPPTCLPGSCTARPTEQGKPSQPIEYHLASFPPIGFNNRIIQPIGSHLTSSPPIGFNNKTLQPIGFNLTSFSSTGIQQQNYSTNTIWSHLASVPSAGIQQQNYSTNKISLGICPINRIKQQNYSAYRIHLDIFPTKGFHIRSRKPEGIKLTSFWSTGFCENESNFSIKKDTVHH